MMRHDARTGTNAPDLRARVTRIGANLAVLALGLAISGLLAEAIVLLEFGEQPKFPRHVVRAPWGLRYNEPSSVYRHKSADMTTYFRINAQGMRDDRDIAYAKPLGAKRVVSLGDSFTIGYEVDVDKTFSSVLEGKLRRAGVNVEVLNAGVSGYSNAEELLYLERELLNYSPDLVLVSFYGNDFGDNIRSSLFELKNSELVALNREYVPAGFLGDFLNTNWLFNLLSERSNAFVFLKEQATRTLKRAIVAKSIERINEAGLANAKTSGADYETQLAVAILDRMYEFLHARNIPLIIQSVPDLLPSDAPPQDWELVELFPLAHFNMDRPGLYFAPAKQWLDERRGHQLLYWTHSHWHWTPFSHAVSGEQLATLILREELLK